MNGKYILKSLRAYLMARTQLIQYLESTNFIAQARISSSCLMWTAQKATADC